MSEAVPLQKQQAIQGCFIPGANRGATEELAEKGRFSEKAQAES
jgi:hypothetical protein